MEQSVDNLWTVCIWYFGTSATFTIVIFGWLMKLSSSINIGEMTKRDIKQILLDVEEIKKVLKGDYGEKGLVVRQDEIEKRVDKLEALV